MIITMKVFRFFLYILLVFLVFSCSRAKETGEIAIYVIKGSSGLCVLPLFENPPRVKGVAVRMVALAGADLAAADFITGVAKVGFLPPNVAAKIASSGRNIQVAAVTGEGMLSLLSSDPDVFEMGDLAGKRVEIAGAGATPEYVFRRLLLNRGLEPGRDVILGFSLAYPEIAQSLISGRISTGLLPEPFASMALGQGADGSVLPIKRIGDIQAEWMAAYGSVFPMTVLVVDGYFAASNSEAVAVILDSIRESIEWVNANPVKAAELTERHDIGINASVATAAIPAGNFVYVPAVNARPSLEALYRVFLEFAPQSIGGSMPGDDFYYSRQP